MFKRIVSATVFAATSSLLLSLLVLGIVKIIPYVWYYFLTLTKTYQMFVFSFCFLFVILFILGMGVYSDDFDELNSMLDEAEKNEMDKN